MAEIYRHWVSAHGVMIVTPVYWGQVPSGLKLMMDRMVCADGGNPDPTTTHGKNPEKAKALELAGWPYPQYLTGRVYGVAVHGDVAGIEAVSAALCDWLDWNGLVDAGAQARLSRYIGYWEPYATSHDALDKDEATFEEVRNVARAVSVAVKELRAGRLSVPDSQLTAPRRKMTPRYRLPAQGGGGCTAASAPWQQPSILTNRVPGSGQPPSISSPRWTGPGSRRTGTGRVPTSGCDASHALRHWPGRSARHVGPAALAFRAKLLNTKRIGDADEISCGGLDRDACRGYE